MVKKVKVDKIFENGKEYIREFFSNGTITKTLKPSKKPVIKEDTDSEITDSEKLLAEILLQQVDVILAQNDQNAAALERDEESNIINAEILLNQIDIITKQEELAEKYNQIVETQSDQEIILAELLLASIENTIGMEEE